MTSFFLELKHCPDTDERRKEYVDVVSEMMEKIEEEIMQIYRGSYFFLFYIT